jgi:hypothetical protein
MNGSTSGYTEVTAPAVAGSNTLVLPSSNGSAHQLLKNSGTAGTLEYGVTLPSGNGLAHQLVKNSASAGTWEYGFTLPSGNGTADQALVTDGSGTLSFADRSRMVLETAQNSTSGTSINFPDIPSWVKRVTVMFNQVSLSGSSQVLIQLGDSGGIETTSYVGGTANVAESTGFQIFLNVNTRAASGLFVLTNLSGNIWVGGGTTWNTSETNTSAGVKQLSATLDRVRITTVNGTDTFDAGSINLLLEG